MSLQELDMGEQAISKLAETGIRSQLDSAEALEVEIHTDAEKLMHGEVENVTITGRGLVMQNDLRTEELVMKTAAVDINMFKAALGNIELEYPTEASVRVVLTGEDIQNAFNADFIKQQLRGQKIELSSGDRVTTDISNIRFSIPETDKFLIQADVMLIEKVKKHSVSFSATPTLAPDGNSVLLKDIDYESDSSELTELTQSIVDTTQNLLNLRNFELDNMSLKFDQLAVEPGTLTIDASAKIEAFA